MKIEVKRLYKKPAYTVGKLYIDGVYQCDTIEDRDRGLSQDDDLRLIDKVKIYGETAIPAGDYPVIVSYSPKFGKNLPLLEHVPCFSGVRIHSGNTAKDSLGCIILGENKKVGQVINSRATCARVLPLIEAAYKKGERISIEIK